MASDAPGEEPELDAPDPIIDGPPVTNTLLDVLEVFPLHSAVHRKRPRSPEASTATLRSILDPSEDEVLAHAFSSSSLGHEMPTTTITQPPPKVARHSFARSFSSKFMAVVENAPPRPRATRPAQVDDTIEYKYGEPNELGVQMVDGRKLFNFQLDAVKWCMMRESAEDPANTTSDTRRGGLLAMCMGLGKTVTAVTLVATSLNDQRALGSCTLYVCPKNLFGTVYHEIKKFFGSSLRIIIYHTDMLKSAFKTFGIEEIRKYDIIITNYETIKFHKTSAVQSFEWYRIILDESHEIRNHRTARFKAFMTLKGARALCMSGTPLFNGIIDIVSQLRFTGFQVPPRIKITDSNFKRLGLHHRIRFVEYVDASSVTLPTKRVNRVPFDLTDKEQELHDKFLRQGRLHPLDDRYRYAHCMTALIRCMQVCSAPYIMTQHAKQEWEDITNSELVENPFTSDTDLNLWLHRRDAEAGVRSSKMTAFVDLIMSLPRDEKIVVFAHFGSTLQVAIAALVERQPSLGREHVHLYGSQKVVERDAALTAFRTRADIRFLFVTMALGSNGLNLTESCKVVMLEPWYSYARLYQAESRVHRIGQTREVDIYYLLARSSVEERVYNTAQMKKAMTDNMLIAREFHMNMEEIENILA